MNRDDNDALDVNRIERGINTAAEIARLSSSRKRVGAALFVGRRLLSLGFNNRRTNPKQRTLFRWEHAETNCLVGTRRFELCNATLYVVRLGLSGSFALSRPCPDCQRILRAAGIHSVWYTNKDGTPERLRIR